MRKKCLCLFIYIYYVLSMCLYKAIFIIMRLILETTSLFNKFIKYKINIVVS